MRGCVLVWDGSHVHGECEGVVTFELVSTSTQVQDSSNGLEKYCMALAANGTKSTKWMSYPFHTHMRLLEDGMLMTCESK